MLFKLPEQQFCRAYKQDVKGEELKEMEELYKFNQSFRFDIEAENGSSEYNCW